MSSINIGELAAQLTTEQLVELCARHFLETQRTFIKDRSVDATLSVEDRQAYLSELTNADELSESTIQFIDNLGFEEQMNEQIKTIAEEFAK